MSNEPGFNLTALLVADRNAKAAVADAKAAQQATSEMKSHVIALERAIAQIHVEIAAIRLQAASRLGSGPTEAD